MRYCALFWSQDGKMVKSAGTAEQCSSLRTMGYLVPVPSLQTTGGWNQRGWCVGFALPVYRDVTFELEFESFFAKS